MATHPSNATPATPSAGRGTDSAPEGEAITQELANPAFDKFGDETEYSSGSRYRGYGLWDNCVHEALKQLPGVDRSSCASEAAGRA